MKKNLIHTLLIAVAFSCVMPTIAQTTFSPKKLKTFEKLYKKAIAEGRDSYGACHKNKSISSKDREGFREYIKQKGCVNLFDGTFIEESLLTDYVCKKYASCSYEDFTKDCYYHYNDWTMEPAKSIIYGGRTEWITYNYKSGLKSHKISWHGNVVNKNINGNGVGFFRDGDSFYIMKNGWFRDGFPFSDVKIIQIGSDGSVIQKLNMPAIGNYQKLLRDKDNIDKFLTEGFYGSPDPLTRKAALALYKDVYDEMYDNAKWGDAMLSKLEESVYNGIASTNQVDFYASVFPNGRHIQEVAQWILYDHAGFRAHQLNTIDKAIDLAQTYTKEKMNGGSDLLEMQTTKPSSDDISTIKNENERLLKKANDYARDIKESRANDKDAQDKVQRFFDYMDILNGFYAARNSLDIGSCVGKDFLYEVLYGGANVYCLNGKGSKIKELFEKALKTINRKFDGHYEEYDLLNQTYDYIYKYYSSFIKAVKAEVSMQNRQYLSGKQNNSSFKEYKFKDGRLVIELNNGDEYTFSESKGKWNLSSGKTDRLFPGMISCNSIQEAIAKAEELNRDYWEHGR